MIRKNIKKAEKSTTTMQVSNADKNIQKKDGIR